ncbi:MAG: dTDP-4-dehydrorhamnose reductase [Candidatus Helarchaeota archaeon]
MDKIDKVLVTGAKGMLGSDLCPIFEADCNVLRTDIDEMDVRNYELVNETISDYQPDLVIHLAALTNVDACEKEPDSSFHTNTLGTQNVALACQHHDITMVYISTMSVFDGEKCEPYTEFDTQNPKSWYSRSKFQGELIVENLLSKYYIVRAGWMFGGAKEDKKFVAKIISLAKNHDHLSIVNDKFGSPTFTFDFALGIKKLIQTDCFGTFHMVNAGKYCSRYEFAQAILNFAGINDCELIPVNSATFPLPAPRPRMEAGRNLQLELRNWECMPNWRKSLKKYIELSF